MSGLRRFAGSSAWLLAENLLRVGATAAVTLWIARALGPQAYGVLALAIALLAVALAPAALGLELPILARLAQGAAPGRVLGTAIVMRGVASLAALLLAAAAAWALHRGDTPAIGATLVVALAIPAYAPSVFDLWFRARVQAGAPALARLAATLLSVALKAAVLLLGHGLAGIAWTVVAEALLSTAALALAWRFARPATPDQRLAWDAATARGLLRAGLPMLAGTVVALLAAKADLLLLGLLSTGEQAGLYGLAQRIAEVLAVLPVVLVDSAYPLVARGARAGDAQLLFDIAGAAAWAATAVALLAVPLLPILTGPAYAASGALLPLLALAGVGIALGVARQRWLAHAGLQGHAPALALLAGLSGVAVGLLLVPRWGAAGAAAAAIVSQLLAGLALPFAFAALRPIGAMQCRALWPWTRLWARGRPRRPTVRLQP